MAGGVTAGPRRDATGIVHRRRVRLAQDAPATRALEGEKYTNTATSGSDGAKSPEWCSLRHRGDGWLARLAPAKRPRVGRGAARGVSVARRVCMGVRAVFLGGFYK